MFERRTTARTATLRSGDNRDDKVSARNRLRIIIRNRCSKVTARHWKQKRDTAGELGAEGRRVIRRRKIVPNAVTLRNRNRAV